MLAKRTDILNFLGKTENQCKNGWQDPKTEAESAALAENSCKAEHGDNVIDLTEHGDNQKEEFPHASVNDFEQDHSVINRDECFPTRLTGFGEDFPVCDEEQSAQNNRDYQLDGEKTACHGIVGACCCVVHKNTPKKRFGRHQGVCPCQ